MPVERAVGVCYNRPHMRVRRRLTCEVASIEFVESGVDVVGVEEDAGHEPVVAIDLHHVEELAAEFSRSQVAVQVSKSEAFPTGRDDGRRHVRVELSEGSHAVDMDISTV